MTDIKNFKILFVEDVPSDVDLAVIELRKEKLKFEHTTVCTKKDLVDALESFGPDLIISDYSMPVFNGMQALKLAKELFPEIPFILLTGSVNEETAVECIKAGAIDYVIKEHMTRLPFAVKEALEHALIEKERKKSELLLNESEDRFLTLYNDAVAGLYRTNAKGEILLANKALIKMLGFNSFEELASINLNKAGVGTTNDRWKFIDKIEKEGIITDLEAVWICRDGREIFVKESAKLIRDTDGKPLYYDGTVEDITQRKIMEDALNESRHLFETMAQSSPVGIFRTKPDGYTTYVNPRWLELSGLTFDESIGFGWLKAVHPDDLEKLKEGWQSDTEASRSSVAEYRFLRGDGSIRWVMGNAVPEWIDNEVAGYIGTITDITHRKLTEKALQVSEEKFRSIAENLSDIIYTTDSEFNISYVSPTISALGYSQEECIGKYIGDFLDDGELEKAISSIQRAFNDEKLGSSILLKVKRKDGSEIFAEFSGSDYMIENENQGLLGLIRDVTDKIHKEIELRKLSQAVEQNPASIVITDTYGIIEYVNPKLCEITGYSREELIGNNPNLLSSKEKSKEDYTTLWNAIRSGNDWKGEFHNKKKNGELYWENATISPIKNMKGEITHFLGIKEDITEKKFMEVSVKANEQRYRELFLNNPVPTYIFDEHTLEFVEVNDATVLNYGYSRKEFANLTLRDFRLPEDITDLLESVKSLGNAVFYSHTMRHRKKNGEVFPVEITSHSLPEKNGRRTRLVIAIDITERIKAAGQMKLAKEKAEASDNLKTTFLNNISHEVRTPLNGILGFAEIMSQPDLSESDKAESLLMLHESSDRLLETITNYMDISMLASGNLTVNKKEFLPAQDLRRLFEYFKEKCSARKLDLVMDIPENGNNFSVNSDPEIIRKIMSHLLNNAVKFTEEGSIHFGYTLLNNAVEFFVRDTGIGISKEAINAVFDHFVKEDRGPTSLSEGSGLGLSIAKGMAELIGGQIGAESEYGKGSVFFITIPVQIENEINVSDIPGKVILRNTQVSSILVAEDDDTNYFYLYTLLNIHTKAKIIHAVNGREAIEMFTANPDIQLILMDIKMPEINGLEATRQIKLLNPDIPVIAITAHAMSGDEERVLAAGCDGYLSKPISKKSLLDKMAEFINIR